MTGKKYNSYIFKIRQRKELNEYLVNCNQFKILWKVKSNKSSNSFWDIYKVLKLLLKMFKIKKTKSSQIQLRNYKD